MKSTLTINDLSSNKALDGKEMSAVRGGVGNQALGEEFANGQLGLVGMNVGSVSKFGSPTTVQADSKVDQHATNDSYSKNFSSLFGSGFPV